MVTVLCIPPGDVTTGVGRAPLTGQMDPGMDLCRSWIKGFRGGGVLDPERGSGCGLRPSPGAKGLKWRFSTTRANRMNLEIIPAMS